MKTLNIYLSVIVLALIFISCDKKDKFEKFNSPVNDLAEGLTNVGSAELKRYSDKISMTFDVGNLVVGNAYTVWWVVWNKSNLCAEADNCKPNPDLKSAEVEVELLFADGMVIGSDGKGSFSGSLDIKDNGGSVNDIIGKPSYGGLQDANREVHLVLRGHGPDVPGLTGQLTSSFIGGCDVKLPGFQTPTAIGECGNIMSAVFAKN